jgi:hypothetical protein
MHVKNPPARCQWIQRRYSALISSDEPLYFHEPIGVAFMVLSNAQTVEMLDLGSDEKSG